MLRDPRLAEATGRLGRDLVKSAITQAQQRIRDGKLTPGELVDAVLDRLPRTATVQRQVINATGILIHTNLGRAPLSAAAVAALEVASGYTDVEFDLATGGRSRRGKGAVAALREAVPLAGDAHVVNNNAAALALTAATLAKGREIVISRGELVEIGDGFRLPDLLVAAGATLREVGTTNRTSLADYRSAIGPETALLLKVHRSNFVVKGFTAEVTVAELAQLGVPVVADTGSGLLDREPLLPDEPDATSALRDGAALVLASGDKLLGGPQCGLILGRADLVEPIRRHPLARAVRADKLTLAALEATLRGPRSPVIQALQASLADLSARASAARHRLAEAGVTVDVVPSESSPGGGAAPDVVLPSVALALPTVVAERLRRGEPAVVGRSEGGRLLLDLRSVDPGQDVALVDAIIRVMQE